MDNQGIYEYYEKDFDVLTDFAGETFNGRKFDKEFAQQLVAVGAVLYPIICTEYQGQFYLIDGRNRVLHCQKICQMSQEEMMALVKKEGVMVLDKGVKPEHFRMIRARVFVNIHPEDQAVWSIILNEQRSDNIIFGWQKVKELTSLGRWDEIARLYKLNPNRFKVYAHLNNLQEGEKWVAAFANGKVTEDTIIQVAKLGKSQPEALKVLDAKGKVTSSDIRVLKSTAVNKQLASAGNMPFNNPAFKPPEQLFVVYDRVNNVFADNPLPFKQAQALLKERTGFKLYKLVEV